MEKIIISTMNDLPGYKVVEVYGEVFGLTTRSRHLISSIGQGLKTIAGGEIGGYTKLQKETREEAMSRLKAEAIALGANAVLAMRFDSSTFDTIDSVAAYGTAVKVEKI
ncbi:MAG: heavy metal-binding domain-containing protein [Streptococcaceae bacterium]|jgi:uncharacterized protein YbjQ (UPF0145 family)|nr:heavy metal-binding domain-containing protein [Streptococcaceae bacterium]